MTPQPANYNRHRFPAKIISQALWLYHVFSLAAVRAAALPISGACAREGAKARLSDWAPSLVPGPNRPSVIHVTHPATTRVHGSGLLFRLLGHHRFGRD